MLELHAVAKAFDLTRTESEIVEFLLQYGSVKSAELRQILHVDRTPFYRALNNLVIKDLVVVTGPLRKQSVELQDLKAISTRLSTKKQELAAAEQSLVKFQASMRELRDKRYHQDNVEIFSGQGSYLRSMNAILSGGGKILRDLTPGHTTLYKLAGSEQEYREIVKEIKAKRIRLGISIRTLMDNQAQKNEKIISPQTFELKEYRFFPGNLHMQCYLNTCGSRTLFYTSDVTGSWGILLKDQLIAKLASSLFDALWAQSHSI
jgi:sugar-specific transcriptional regulator TrmB